MQKNTIYTNGFVNNDGAIEVPGVFLEDGTKVHLKITAMPGFFEVAMFPFEAENADFDCGISDEEIERVCALNDGNCDECVLCEHCGRD